MNKICIFIYKKYDEVNRSRRRNPGGEPVQNVGTKFPVSEPTRSKLKEKVSQRTKFVISPFFLWRII